VSAAIRKIHYKPEIEELSIWFGPDFRRYKYFGVPPEIVEALENAPSRGRFFNAFIKGHFSCALADPSDYKNRQWLAMRDAHPPGRRL
jgi:hypothetical protein